MGRRTLDYRSFDELRADVRSLMGRRYHRAGTWSLGQVCDHLDKMFTMTLDGFAFKMPLALRLFAGPIKKWMLKKRKMPTGVKGPPTFMPADEGSLNDHAAAERLLQTIDRYTSHAGELHPSPLFGKLTREEWDQIHLIHSAHHLSFIVPE
jgi:hypothetical protein